MGEKALLFQLVQEGPDLRRPGQHFGHGAGAVGAVGGAVLEAQVLFQIDDGVQPEAGDPLVQPPVYHIADLPPDLRVFPVQVRLLLGEGVEVIEVRAGQTLPAAPAELRPPVVGRAAVPPRF